MSVYYDTNENYVEIVDKTMPNARDKEKDLSYFCTFEENYNSPDYTKLENWDDVYKYFEISKKPFEDYNMKKIEKAAIEENIYFFPVYKNNKNEYTFSNDATLVGGMFVNKEKAVNWFKTNGIKYDYLNMKEDIFNQLKDELDKYNHYFTNSRYNINIINYNGEVENNYYVLTGMKLNRFIDVLFEKMSIKNYEIVSEKEVLENKDKSVDNLINKANKETKSISKSKIKENIER